ncbi:type II toxin-antitoxin system Phd/YefM family antitoxin [Tropicimonas marinistellae]|uniref:type II toxin-antitoxin system Phd/YefM family antitoxin n=1 Tax=Tropicimonas marinistellae TaxID=1739787 RepID=UPI0008297805|nr:type II toxin-antitoxin system Phd/YefM family antitoxin [Tropicimonas marinistellae]
MSILSPTPHIRSEMIPVTQFRTNIAMMLPQVVNIPMRLVLTRHGKPYCAVVSMRDLTMVERFDGHSLANLRAEQDDIACRYAAAQEAGRSFDGPTISGL